MLDLLKKLGVTSEADLRLRLGVKEDNDTSDGEPEDSVTDALKKLLGDTPEPTPSVPEPGDQNPVTSEGGKHGDGRASGTASGGAGGAGLDGDDYGDSEGRGARGAKRTPGAAGGRPFVSYVGAHPEGEEPDPDGLDQLARMALEESAIELIRAREPEWHLTPTHNPVFDLFERGSDGQPIRWCEVKAMSGRLDDRPVGMSRSQFECAREHGTAYWLYAVELAGSEQARIVRIQDPAGKAHTFTFDQGWVDVAELDPESDERED